MVFTKFEVFQAEVHLVGGCVLLKSYSGLNLDSRQRVSCRGILIKGGIHAANTEFKIAKHPGV